MRPIVTISILLLWSAFLSSGGEAASLYAAPRGGDGGHKTITVNSAFGLDCRVADAFVADHRAAWRSIWGDMEVDARVAEAVVYPELIRYSCWQDEMEKSAVAGGYLTLGSRGPDFSVGHFQMKASWVERLEKRWMRCPLHRTLEIYFDTSDSRFARKARLARLSDDDFWQPLYLALFLRLLYIDYPDLAALPLTEQVRLCATAYNNGASLPGPGLGDIDRLYQWSSLSSFHTDLVPTAVTSRYCYAEIAATHYGEMEE